MPLRIQFDGTGILSANNEYVSYSQPRRGNFAQNGGTNSVSSALYIRYPQQAPGPAYSLTGRPLSAPKRVCPGIGDVHTDCGTNSVTSGLYLGTNNDGGGIYNLNGGTLVVNALPYAGFNSGVFNFGGGTLKATGSFTTACP